MLSDIQGANLSTTITISFFLLQGVTIQAVSNVPFAQEIWTNHPPMLAMKKTYFVTNATRRTLQISQNIPILGNDLLDLP